MAGFDVDKWKKKFFIVFTRERGILDLSINPSLQLDIKNMTLNPMASTRVGERILKSNVKFWVLFIRIVAEKLNDFAKAILRERLLAGTFPKGSPDYDLLIKEVGSIIDTEKLKENEAADQINESADNLPRFGGSDDK